MTTTFRWRAAIKLGLWLALPVVPRVGQSQAVSPRTAAPASARAVESRDQWQRVPEIIAALDLRVGGRVADVGAGEGWLSTRLAKHVGPSGRVFAVDIMEPALQQLQRTAATEGLDNIELILSEPDDPRLPYASLDGIVIVNAYHEMAQRVAMLAGFRQALKPGGVLVIVENTPSDSLAPRLRQTANHQLGIVHAEDDLVASGFEIVRREPDFIVQLDEGHSHKQWLIVARRVKK